MMIIDARFRALDPELQTRVERTFEALEGRGFQPIFAPDRAAALAKLLELIPHGARIAHGSSVTLHEIGLVDYLQQPGSPYHYQNPKWMAENDMNRRTGLRGELSLHADYFLGSVQAVCETGEAIGSDMGGSRQAFYVFGPPHVIWVAGINKLVGTVEEGIRRVREVALPLEDQRVKSIGGKGSYVSKLVIYERERPGRITLIMVGESLGY